MKYLIALIAFLGISITLNAQQIPAKQPTFKIKVRLPGNKPSGGDSIYFRYLKPYQPIGLPEFKPGPDNYILTDKNGDLEIKLPAFDEPMMINLRLVYYGGLKSNSDVPDRNTTIGQFLVEKTDNITVHITKTGKHDHDTFSISGYGSEKYALAPLLENLCDDGLAGGEFGDAANKIWYPDGKRDTTDRAGQIAKYCLLADRFLKKKADMIDRSGLSTKMKKLLAYNFAPIFDSWIFSMYHSYMKSNNNPQLRKTIKENIERYKKQFSYPVDSLMALAPKFLIKNIGSQHLLQVIDIAPRKIEFADMYNLIINNYTGKQRELLIANLFMKGYGWRGTEPLAPQMLDSLMQDGDQYLSTPIIKKAYATKLKLTGGSPLFNAKFKDINGKDISLASFKGKVMLLDMWFTGCGACMDFHQRFHKDGYPLIKDNKDFVYVSVSIDQSKPMWLKSLATSQYTSADYVNLNAEQGLKDPFLQYYERNSLPFLILVDKNGKIYASNPVPDPKAVLKLIYEALKIPDTGK